MNELIEKVTAELEKSGFPLEMKVARALEKAGFSVVQGDHYEDADTKKWREVDVVAYSEQGSASCRSIFALAVECKSAVDKPWTVFASTVRYPEQLGVIRRPSTEPGTSVLRVLSLREEIRQSPLFALPSRPGHGMTVMFRKPDNNIDPAHEAMHSVCKATLGLLDRLKKVETGNVIPYVWPIVVTAAPLFECYLDESDRMIVTPIDRAVVVWRNPVVTRHTIVHIYSPTAFVEHAPDLRQASLNFLREACAEHDRSPRQRPSDTAERFVRRRLRLGKPPPIETT